MDREVIKNVLRNVRFGSKADILVRKCEVRFAPKSGHRLAHWEQKPGLPRSRRNGAAICGGGIEMPSSDLALAYRLHATKCIEIAHQSSNPESKLALLDMAQAWMALAEQAVKNSETVLVYETPLPNRS